MRTSLMSLNAAITLSFIAYVTGLALLLLVAPYDPEFKDFIDEPDQPRRIGLMILLFMGIYGGRIWALAAAARSRRGGVIAALPCSLLVGLDGGLLTIVSFCPKGCGDRPVGDIIV